MGYGTKLHRGLCRSVCACKACVRPIGQLQIANQSICVRAPSKLLSPSKQVGARCSWHARRSGPADPESAN